MKAATAIDKIEEITITCCHESIRSKKLNINSFKKRPRTAIFGTTAKNADTLVGAPSYTSGVQTWKGAAAALNNRAEPIKKAPTITPVGISFEVIPANNLAISSKLVVPVNPYTREDPNNRRPEAKAPKMKYFSPASVENGDLRLKAAKTYKHKLDISIAKYIVIRSFEDTRIIDPTTENRMSNEYSKV